MEIQTTVKYFTRPGIVWPLREEIHSTSAGIISSSGFFNEATDTEVTETQYDALLAAHIATVDVAKDVARQARADMLALIQSQKAAIKIKLMAGDPLTGEEADIVLMEI